jgi:hypothetical protein
MRHIELAASLTNAGAEGRHAPCSSKPASGNYTLKKAGDDGRSYLLERDFVVPLAKSARDAVLRLFPLLNNHMPANQSN